MIKVLRLADLADSSLVKFGTSGVRGLVTAMSYEVCYAYTLAFLSHVVKKSGSINSIVLGHDLRPSSPDILINSIQAVIDSGLNVSYVGILPTPAIAYYAQKRESPAIVITGSHIPFDRNGIKFYRSNGEITKADEQAIIRSTVSVPDHYLSGLPSLDMGAYEAYLDRYLNFFGENSLHGMRIALYEHSSVARDLLRDLLTKLGAEVLSLGRTDSFIPIDTEAVRKQDVEQAKLWASQNKFDAILSTDGDADRPLIGDECGNWLRGDIVGILTAKYLNADTVVTPVSSNTALEKSKWFTQVIRTKIGSPYVIAGMEHFDSFNNLVVGFEANGGFLLGSDIDIEGRKLERLPTRDAVLPMLSILSMSRQLNYKISELPNLLPERFTYSDRIQNFQSNKSIFLLEQLNNDTVFAANLMAPHSGQIISIDLTDGFRAAFSNEDIVHIRPSGNAPELRCYSESNTEDNAMKLCLDCLKKISEKFI